jgi:2,5-diketo-D-gluconate reductase A
MLKLEMRTMAGQSELTFNDGNSMPQFGLGVWQILNDQTAEVVQHAFRAGYRLVDTAAVYGNEEGVGKAIASVDVPRDKLFITTKLANPNHGFDETLRAFDESLGRMSLDYVDLYLIHWPRPSVNRYVDTWRALIQLKEEGRARSIGVSNFAIPTLERIIGETGVVPALNQVELHPRFQQRDMRAYHAKHGIVTQSWSPLGRGRVTEDPTIADLAVKYRKTWAQIVIRWHLDSGLSVIPRSVSPERLRQNIDVFDFKLTPKDIARINELDDSGGRIGAHPDHWGV